MTQPSMISDRARIRSTCGVYNLMGKAEGDLGDLAKAGRYFRKTLASAAGAEPDERDGVLLVEPGDAFELGQDGLLGGAGDASPFGSSSLQVH